MRIAVFGATGGTGRHVVEQALRQDHEVRAVVRDHARLPISHDRLLVYTADVFDPAAVAPAVTGVDVVVSTLGHRSSKDPVCSQGTRAILEAMEGAGTKRLIAVSAAPVLDSDEGDRTVYRLVGKPLLRFWLKDPYADMKLMEEQIYHSATDWTIIRPPRLTNKPWTGRYRTAVDRNLPGGYLLARADLADAILHSITDPATIRAGIGIAN